MTFTPHLKLYEKKADGGRGVEILGAGVEESVTLRLGQEVGRFMFVVVISSLILSSSSVLSLLILLLLLLLLLLLFFI